MAMPSKRFRENIAFYAIGVAIGLTLVGMLMLARQRMAQAPQSAPASAPAQAPAR